MSDKLEKFFKENKSAFDAREPSDNVWSRISGNLFPKYSWVTPLALWRAAAVLFMALSGYLLYPQLGAEKQEKEEAKQEQLVLNEFKPVEEFYVKQIAEKVDMIHKFRGPEAGMNGYTADFQQLEAMYFVLKEQMKSSPSQKVKDALVLNLLVRIDLLNQQLEELDPGKNQRQAENGEKVNA